MDKCRTHTMPTGVENTFEEVVAVVELVVVKEFVKTSSMHKSNNDTFIDIVLTRIEFEFKIPSAYLRVVNPFIFNRIYLT